MESATEVLLNHCSWLKTGQVETLARRNLDAGQVMECYLHLQTARAQGWSKEDLLSSRA